MTRQLITVCRHGAACSLRQADVFGATLARVRLGRLGRGRATPTKSGNTDHAQGRTPPARARSSQTGEGYNVNKRFRLRAARQRP